MKTSSFICRHVRNLTAYTPGEQPQIPGLIKLNTNENPYPPSPKVAQVLKAFDFADLRRYPDPVCAALRHEIARLHECTVSQVFVGNGSDEILALATRAFVEDDGSIGYFNPSYSLYPVLTAIRNATPRPVELPADFSWTMPSGYRASLFLMTNPNAPTGVLYPHDDVEAFCRATTGVVLIDEAYVDFSKNHCMDLALSLGNVLVLRTLSKSYSLAGLRVGYVVGDQALIDALYKLKDSYNVDVLAQRLAGVALADQDYMKINAARIIATRQALTCALKKMKFDVVPSETNFIWAKPPAASAKSVFLALREKAILVRYFEGERTGDYVRITVGTEEEIDRLLVAMSAIAV